MKPAIDTLIQPHPQRETSREDRLIEAFMVKQAAELADYIAEVMKDLNVCTGRDGQ